MQELPWTKDRAKPTEDVMKKHTPNAYLIRYKNEGGRMVELSGATLAELSKKAEVISKKAEEVWLAELFDDGEKSLAGTIYRYVKGKAVSHHHNSWSQITVNLDEKKSKAKKPADAEEKIEKIQTVKSVDTQEGTKTVTKVDKKAAGKPEAKAKGDAPKEGKKAGKSVEKSRETAAPKATEKKAASTEADKAKAKRPAKISGKLEKIEVPADKPVGKREAEALFNALAIKENSIRWKAARFLADSMGVAIPAEKLIQKVYGKEGGTAASIGRVIDGIHFDATKKNVKVIISAFKRDGKFHYRMEKA